MNICKKIKNFKGVFMRDELNDVPFTENGSFILNTDSSDNDGTHWTCLCINNSSCIYFDPYGLPPPTEVLEFCKSASDRIYSSFPIQNLNSVLCGHFSAYVLLRLNDGVDFFEVLEELYNNKDKY